MPAMITLERYIALTRRRAKFYKGKILASIDHGDPLFGHNRHAANEPFMLSLGSYIDAAHSPCLPSASHHTTYIPISGYTLLLLSLF